MNRKVKIMCQDMRYTIPQQLDWFFQLMLKNSIIALLWKSKLISSFEDGTPQPSNYTKTISVKATSFAQCLYVLEKVGTARLAVLPR